MNTLKQIKINYSVNIIPIKIIIYTTFDKWIWLITSFLFKIIVIRTIIIEYTSIVSLFYMKCIITMNFNYIVIIVFCSNVNHKIIIISIKLFISKYYAQNEKKIILIMIKTIK